MAWDEGNAILRAEQIPHQWQYTTRVEGHPAFYGIVIAVGQWLAHAWLKPLDAARFGPMMLFAAAAGAMFYRMGRDYSLVAAAGAVAALMLLPRMFAHAHFASFDGPLTSCWILAWAAFPGGTGGSSTMPGGTGGSSTRVRDNTGGEAASATRAGQAASATLRSTLPAIILWGITLGMTLSCKATGWLAPLPFLVWAVVYRDHGAARALALGLPAALLTFFLLNPPLWQEPIQGWGRFFSLNCHRGAEPGLNISTQFFGRMYNLDYPLPWYNTAVWVGITVPLGTLLLAGVGLVGVLRRPRHDRAGTLLVANWLVLLVVRAMPGTPPHDAERLILPSFAFLAALAGVGCAKILPSPAGRGAGGEGCSQHGEAKQGHRSANPHPNPLPAGEGTWHAAVLLVVLLYLSSASSLLWYAPQWLSYYNLLIGGLPGATAAGMEPTYYWDALDQSVLDWLNEHTAEDQKIWFAAGSEENLELMQRWGVLRRATSVEAPGKFRWYVLQRRPSGLQEADLWLIEYFEPAFTKTIRCGGVGPWRLDVPLVEVYSCRDAVQAAKAVKAQK